MKKIRRINLFSGPSAGKSTIATWLFSKLKMDDYNIEYVSEYIKFWTYIPRSPNSWDSLYCQAKQIHKEDTILREDKVDIIISDSPIPLACYYAHHHNNPGKENLLRICKEFEDMYPSVNIFLERDDSHYKEVGRYENLKEAKIIDKEILDFLKCNEIKYNKYSVINKEEILNYILKEIK